MSIPDTREDHNNEPFKKPLDLTINVNAQLASPLFTVFPPEIRAEIFAIAVSRFQDLSKPYTFDSYWYRLGYIAPERTELSLLVTCKRIYGEAKDLVWKRGSGNDEEAFWWGSDDRRPLEYRGGRVGSPYDEYFDSDPEADGENYDIWAHESSEGSVDDELDHEAVWEVNDDEELDYGLGHDDMEGWYERHDTSLEESQEELGDDLLEAEDPVYSDAFVEESRYEFGEGDELDGVYAVSPEESQEDLASDAWGDPDDYDGLSNGDDDYSDMYGLHSSPGPSDSEYDPRERHIEMFLASLEDDMLDSDLNGPPQSERQRALFTFSHWSRIRSIQIFPQMYAFSSREFLRTFGRAHGLRPRTVKVTIRYTDWWNWEENKPLALRSLVPERNAVYFPESVDTFIIELESAEHKKSELDTMVKQVLEDKATWKWKRLDDEYLEVDEAVGVGEWNWMGTTKFDGVSYAHHPKEDLMKYIVKVLTFTAKPCQIEWDGTRFDRAVAIKNYEASP